MKRKTQLLLTFGVLIILIGGLYIFTDAVSRLTGYFTGEDEPTRLAHCLDGKGAEFYGTEFCADCEKQKAMFGQPFKSINQIDCGKDKEFCPNIREIPAWYINKEIHYGLKEFEELRELSGCTGE